MSAYDPRHDEETLRVLEHAARRVAESCDCAGGHAEHSEQCTRDLDLALRIAQDEILRVIDDHTHDVRREIRILTLESDLRQLRSAK